MTMYGGGGPGAPGGGGQLLRSAIDAGDQDEVLGKVFDRNMVARLVEYMSRVKSHLILGGTGVVVRTASNLITPLLVGMAINHIRDGNSDGVNVISLVYLGVLAVTWGAQYLETLHLSYAGQGILLRMRTQMFSHLHQLSLSFFDRNKVGKIMSRVQNDVDQLQTLVTQDFIMVAVNAVTLIGIALIMLVLNWRLALLALSTLPILVAVMVVWQSYARRAFVRVRKTIAVVNDNLQESISGVRVTQSLSARRRTSDNLTPSTRRISTPTRRPPSCRVSSCR